MSSVSLEKRKSEIQSLLEQKPSSAEGLQDKLKLLLEEWSEEEEVCMYVHTVCVVCMYILHTYTQIGTHAHVHTHTHTHTHTHAYCICTHMCTHACGTCPFGSLSVNRILLTLSAARDLLSHDVLVI